MMNMIEKKWWNRFHWKNSNNDINVHTHDVRDELRIDRRSTTDYKDTSAWMRCDKELKNMKAMKHLWWINEIYISSWKKQFIQINVDKIEDLCNDLIKKDKNYLLFNFNPVVADEDGKYYPYACAFDFEAMLKKIKTEGNERNYHFYIL